MLKLRMQYRKEGPARYISHLDLMRVFRRAFARAEVPLSFSQGFNPHPYLSVVLPLPTGFSSRCELLDFNAELDRLPDDFLTRMTAALPEGIVPQYVYLRTRPVGDIAAVRCRIGIHGEGFSVDDTRALFSRPVRMMKKTKRGESEVDICTFIRSLEVSALPDGVLIDCVLAAGNDNLNPEYLTRALDEYTPCKIAYAEYTRVDILDAEGESYA